jgi:hypothetical protein
MNCDNEHYNKVYKKFQRTLPGEGKGEGKKRDQIKNPKY